MKTMSRLSAAERRQQNVGSRTSAAERRQQLEVTVAPAGAVTGKSNKNMRQFGAAGEI